MAGLKDVMVAGLVIATFIFTSAMAFISPSTPMTCRGVARASARSRNSERGLLMASRPNAKKEKRQRNRDNMRKFTKKGTSRKKLMRVQRQERAAEAESDFMAQVFHTGMDDWEEDDIFAED